MLTPAQAAFLAGLPQRPSGYNPFRNREAGDRAAAHRAAAHASLPVAHCRQSAQPRRGPSGWQFTRTPTPFLAPHFVEMVLAAAGDQPPVADRDDARRRRCRRDVAGIISSHRGIARSARRGERRRRRARQRDAASGWRGRDRATTPTPRTAARSTAPLCAAAARVGAEALHLRARVRVGLHAGERARRRAVAFPDRRAGRALQPAQLRRPVSRPAAGAAGAGRLGERSGGRPGVGARRADAAALPDRGPASRRSIERRRTTASA